jgi:hypothetical protein
MASGLRGQWKTRKPANSRSASTRSRGMVVSCKEGKGELESRRRNGRERKAHLLVVHSVDPLVTERKNARSTLSVPLVRLLVILRNTLVHLFERLGSSLDSDEGANGRRTGLNERDGRHALELGRELEPTANGDTDLGVVSGRGELVTGRELPLEGVEGGLLHRVSNDSVVEHHEGVSGSEGEGGLEGSFGNGDELLAVVRAENVKEVSAKTARETRRNALDANDTLNNKVLTSNRSSLVEAADVDAAGEGNAERLGTEDGCGVEKSQSSRLGKRHAARKRPEHVD